MAQERRDRLPSGCKPIAISTPEPLENSGTDVIDSKNNAADGGDGATCLSLPTTRTESKTACLSLSISTSEFKTTCQSPPIPTSEAETIRLPLPISTQEPVESDADVGSTKQVQGSPDRDGEGINKSFVESLEGACGREKLTKQFYGSSVDVSLGGKTSQATNIVVAVPMKRTLEVSSCNENNRFDKSAKMGDKDAVGVASGHSGESHESQQCPGRIAFVDTVFSPSKQNMSIVDEQWGDEENAGIIPNEINHIGGDDNTLSQLPTCESNEKVVLNPMEQPQCSTECATQELPGIPVTGINTRCTNGPNQRLENMPLISHTVESQKYAQESSESINENPNISSEPLFVSIESSYNPNPDILYVTRFENTRIATFRQSGTDVQGVMYIPDHVPENAVAFVDFRRNNATCVFDPPPAEFQKAVESQRKQQEPEVSAEYDNSEMPIQSGSVESSGRGFPRLRLTLRFKGLGSSEDTSVSPSSLQTTSAYCHHRALVENPQQATTVCHHHVHHHQATTCHHHETPASYRQKNQQSNSDSSSSYSSDWLRATNQASSSDSDWFGRLDDHMNLSGRNTTSSSASDIEDSDEDTYTKTDNVHRHSRRSCGKSSMKPQGITPKQMRSHVDEQTQKPKRASRKNTKRMKRMKKKKHNVDSNGEGMSTLEFDAPVSRRTHKGLKSQRKLPQSAEYSGRDISFIIPYSESSDYSACQCFTTDTSDEEGISVARDVTVGDTVKEQTNKPLAESTDKSSSPIETSCITGDRPGDSKETVGDSKAEVCDNTTSQGDVTANDDPKPVTSKELNQAVGRLFLEVVVPLCAGSVLSPPFVFTFDKIIKKLRSGELFYENPVQCNWLCSGSKVERLTIQEGWGQKASDIDNMYLYGGAWAVHIEGSPVRRVAGPTTQVFTCCHAAGRTAGTKHCKPHCDRGHSMALTRLNAGIGGSVSRTQEDSPDDTDSSNSDAGGDVLSTSPSAATFSSDVDLENHADDDGIRTQPQREGVLGSGVYCNPDISQSLGNVNQVHLIDNSNLVASNIPSSVAPLVDLTLSEPTGDLGDATEETENITASPGRLVLVASPYEAYCRVRVEGDPDDIARHMAGAFTPGKPVTEKAARQCIVFRDGTHWLSSLMTLRTLVDVAAGYEDTAISGPAGIDEKVDWDLVPALLCSGPYLCMEAFMRRTRCDIWPRPDTLQEMCSLPGLLVAVGIKSNPDKDIQWRYSFSLIEILLSRDMPSWVMQGYRAFKYAAKGELRNVKFVTDESGVSPIMDRWLMSQGIDEGEEGRSKLCTFHLKTILLWELESSEVWQKECPYFLFRCLNKRFARCVNAGFIPHYFLPSCNLLENVSNDEHATIRKCATNLMSDPLHCLLLCPHFAYQIYGKYQRYPCTMEAIQVEARTYTNLIPSDPIYSSFRFYGLEVRVLEKARTVLDNLRHAADAWGSPQYEHLMKQVAVDMRKLDRHRARKYQKQRKYDRTNLIRSRSELVELVRLLWELFPNGLVVSHL